MASTRRSVIPTWVMLVGLIFIALVGLGTLGGGIGILIWVVRFRWLATRAVGEVVGIHAQWQDVTRSDDTGSWTQRMLIHYPVIAFEDEVGARHEVRGNIGGCKPGYGVGEKVPVLFLRGNPPSMRIDSLSERRMN